MDAAWNVLSIFFPMWNEEDYVERAIDAARRVVATMVADEARSPTTSSDRRRRLDRPHPELADELAAGRPPRPGRPPRAQPQARRLDQDRLRHATGDLILYSDADLPFDMEEVPRAVRLLREYDADIVSAYRFDRTGEGYLRAIYTFFYNLLIRWMFGVKARDINFAFKLCRRRVFDHIELRSEGRSSTPS